MVVFHRIYIFALFFFCRIFVLVLLYEIFVIWVPSRYVCCVVFADIRVVLSTGCICVLLQIICVVLSTDHMWCVVYRLYVMCSLQIICDALSTYYMGCVVYMIYLCCSRGFIFVVLQKYELCCSTWFACGIILKDLGDLLSTCHVCVVMHDLRNMLSRWSNVIYWTTKLTSYVVNRIYICMLLHWRHVCIILQYLRFVVHAVLNVIRYYFVKRIYLLFLDTYKLLW